MIDYLSRTELRDAVVKLKEVTHQMKGKDIFQRRKTSREGQSKEKLKMKPYPLNP